MSLKKHFYNRGIKTCRTCKFIDEYAFNVSDKGKVPHGYDSSALCGLFNEVEEETKENHRIVSPCWPACQKYERCSEAQALYKEIYDIKTQTVIPNPNDISKIEQK